MAAVWPVSLPQEPLAPGFTRRPDPSGRIASQMDVGPSKVRRRRALRTKPFDVTYPIPRDDFGDFEEFFEDTIEGGTLPFDWPDPLTEETVRVRFRPGETEPYSAALEQGGKFYLVTLKLEELP